MHDYGIWTVITPLVTIFLAIFTRQVILSLLAGIFVGFVVINHSLLGGIGATLNGIIDTFASAGNARTVVFMVMIGGGVLAVILLLLTMLNEKKHHAEIAAGKRG